MKTLKCEQCGKTIEPDDWGLKYDDLYFCSQECLNEHVNWDTYPITSEDIERDGEEEPDEDDEDEDEIVNDYDIQMGYAND